MRRLISILLLLFVLVPVAIGAEFWGSSRSSKYHFPSCRWAQKISPQNLIKFSSPSDAQKHGYVPCKVCRPPK
jgi:methylphosphotriester-DNA--protein-cysteine methyltransferase